MAMGIASRSIAHHRLVSKTYRMLWKRPCQRSLNSNVTISHNNPYGAKFAGTNGGGAVKGQAWDWAASSWIAVSYQDNGTTSIPDSAVNPATGEVRVKLSSDGQFASGFLSISGNVK